MNLCGAPHENGQTCHLEGNHEMHVAGFGSMRVMWPNADYVKPPPRIKTMTPAERRDAEAALRAMAENVEPVGRPPSLEGPGRVGWDHPEQSHVAAGSVRAGTHRAHLLDIVVQASSSGGITCYDAAPRLSVLVGKEISRNHTATRMDELLERGLVTQLQDDRGPVVRQTSPGNTGQVWVALAPPPLALMNFE